MQELQDVAWVMRLGHRDKPPPTLFLCRVGTWIRGSGGLDAGMLPVQRMQKFACGAVIFKR